MSLQNNQLTGLKYCQFGLIQVLLLSITGLSKQAERETFLIKKEIKNSSTKPTKQLV